MKRPIETLMNEHRMIERVLSSLVAFGAEMAQDPGSARQYASSFAEFFRTFADHCHHGKEEDFLFTALERSGMPRSNGPVGVMLHEHDLGRAYVRELSAFGEETGPPSSQELERAKKIIEEYATLLRSHIQKEDQVLFPTSERVLTPEAIDDLLVEFDAFEKRHVREGIQERMHALADRLTSRFGNDLEK